MRKKQIVLLVSLLQEELKKDIEKYNKLKDTNKNIDKLGEDILDNFSLLVYLFKNKIYKVYPQQKEFFDEILALRNKKYSKE